MARANAAIDTSAPARRQALGHIVAANASRRYEKAEAALRRGLPYLLLLFFGILTISAIFQARDAHDRALANTAREMELLATILAADIEARSTAFPALSATDLSERVVGERTLGAGRRIVWADFNSDFAVLVKDPAFDANLVPDQFVAGTTPYGMTGHAAAQRVTMPDGGDSLVSFRTLRAPLGQFALVQPVTQLLADWWITALRSGLLLLSVCIVLAAICSAYLWQVGRARDLENVSNTLRSRIDVALSRGGCGLWDWDIARGRIYWSNSMYEILGRTSESTYIAINELRSLTHPDDRMAPEVFEQLASRDAMTMDKVMRMKTASGDWVWLRAKAQKVTDSATGDMHLVGIAVDISAEVRNRELAQRADLRVREAVEGISDAFVVWDADARLVLNNSKFEELRKAGITPAPTFTKQPTPDTDKIGVLSGVTDPSANFETQTPDGRWFQFDEWPTRDGGLVSVGRDVTAFKVHEAELLASESKLTATVAALQRSRQALELQSQQLAEIAERYMEEREIAQSANLAKSDFLANMSHELRTPLNAIIGFSQLMENEVFGTLGCDRYNDYARDIHKSGTYLLRLVEDVLDMSRLESRRMQLHKSDFQISGVIGETVRSFAVAARAKNISIRSDGWLDVSLHADRAAIERVLKTLVANAVKFTPNGGKVSVRARLVGNAVNIYVENSGAGIARGAISRIGQPFVQLDDKLENGMKGSGLGLAIARSLVELHLGSLRIRSLEGTGTIFMVHLPRAGSVTAPLPLAAS